MKSVPGALLVVFVTLKLCGVIDWSWWWVMAPLWGCFVVAVPLAVASEMRRARREERDFWTRHGR